MSRIFPKINNWNEVKEQFGLSTPKDGYKNAQQISKDLTNAVNAFDFEKAPLGETKSVAYGVQVHKAENDAENSIVCVDYQIDNVDSGICIFHYVGLIDGVPTFDYTGTAK